MDWPVALTLVHLQHKHQQEQQHQRQQQWQQQQQHTGSNPPPASSSTSSVAASRRAGQHRNSLHSRSSMSSGLLRGLGCSGAANSLDAVAPLLPVPSESVYLQVGSGAGWLGGAHRGGGRRVLPPFHPAHRPCIFWDRDVQGVFSKNTRWQ